MARRPTSNKPPKTLRVIMVELKVDMENTPVNTFFGSKKAIFEYFGEKTLGLSYRTSLTIDFTQGYENKRCRITEGRLFTINSLEVTERRKREGREEIPTFHKFIKTE